MSKHAYIYTQPDNIQFSLPYSDGSGQRIKVSIDEKRADVRIETIDTILVSVEDIDWLRQALDDIKSIIRMKEDDK